MANNISTSKEREQAFILVFEKAFNPDTQMTELYDMAVENEYIVPSSFTKKLAFSADERCGEIDEIIEKYSVGWKISRISKVALSVLRIAVCEMLSEKSAPVGVVINEAVELCKMYAEKSDYSFVNGILSSVAKGELG